MKYFDHQYFSDHKSWSMNVWEYANPLSFEEILKGLRVWFTKSSLGCTTKVQFFLHVCIKKVELQIGLLSTWPTFLLENNALKM